MDKHSQLTLQAILPQGHYSKNSIGFLQVRTNQISRNYDFVILQKIFRKKCNKSMISKNALNSFLVVSLILH